MTVAEASPVVEKIPFLVKMAAGLVPVDEYFKLAHHSGVNVHAQGAFSRGAAAISNWLIQQGEGKLFDATEAVTRSLDPKIFWARSLLKKVTLPQYLEAHQAVLAAEISFNQQRMAYFEEAGVYPKELENAWAYGEKLSLERGLTHAVMQAVEMGLQGQSL